MCDFVKIRFSAPDLKHSGRPQRAVVGPAGRGGQSKRGRQPAAEERVAEVSQRRDETAGRRVGDVKRRVGKAAGRTNRPATGVERPAAEAAADSQQQKGAACLRLPLFRICLSYRNYSMISVTTPEPTVLPPSLMANLSPSSIAIGVIRSISIVMLSPGIHISTPSGSFRSPVTSVVLK